MIAQIAIMTLRQYNEISMFFCTMVDFAWKETTEVEMTVTFIKKNNRMHIAVCTQKCAEKI